MTDKDYIYYANKKRRRKKKHEGQNWDQSDLINELEAAKRKGRMLCRTCHRYQPWSKLRAVYEKVSKRWVQLVWYCPDCNNALKTMDICVKPKKKDRRKP